MENGWDYSKAGQAFLDLQVSNLIFTLDPLSDDQILDWPKLKQIADDILKCI